MTLSKRDLADAAHAWEIGGTQALGAWFARHKALCAGDYSVLVAAVRRYLGDTTDYARPARAMGEGEG